MGYTTFLAYDEVAHHSGVERVDALAVLRRLDRQIARIAAAADDAPWSYHLVVLSDHGQSQGRPSSTATGRVLEDVVSEACATAEVEAEDAHSDEALPYLGASLTEASGAEGALGRSVRAATRGKRVDGEVMLGEDRERERDPVAEDEQESSCP